MKQILILKEPIGSIRKTGDLFNKIKKININYEQENLILFTLDTKNVIINYRVIATGGLNSCICDPKTIFRYALKDNSNAIIIAHNHPSMDLKPSREDIEIFNNLKKAGEFLFLECLDSVIFNKNEYYSLRESL